MLEYKLQQKFYQWKFIEANKNWKLFRIKLLLFAQTFRENIKLYNVAQRSVKTNLAITRD